MEEVGVEVVAIISDLGNQQLKKEIEFKNKETIKFENPFDPTRSVHVFCDIPHLIKLLRNHVLDSGILLPCGEVLNKDIYMELLAKDMSEYQIKVTVHKHINIFGAERQ